MRMKFVSCICPKFESKGLALERLDDCSEPEEFHPPINVDLLTRTPSDPSPKNQWLL
jgi:hypothetical protein